VDICTVLFILRSNNEKFRTLFFDLLDCRLKLEHGGLMVGPLHGDGDLHGLLVEASCVQRLGVVDLVVLLLGVLQRQLLVAVCRLQQSRDSPLLDRKFCAILPCWFLEIFLTYVQLVKCFAYGEHARVPISNNSIP
jgi:hypothetical protein